MEVFRADIRNIVLTLKSSEEKQKKYKEELVELYRTVQKYSVPAPYTKQLLKNLKEINDLYKSSKKLLLVTLIKNHEQNCMDIKRANESTTTSVVEDEHLNHSRKSQIDVVKQSIREKCGLKQKSSKSQPNSLDNSIRTTSIPDMELSSE